MQSIKVKIDLPFIELEGKFTSTVLYTLEGWSKNGESALNILFTYRKTELEIF